MERTDLLVETMLSCGCHIPLGILYYQMGDQLLKGEPVICPFHKVTHNFSANADAQKVAVGLVAVARGIVGPLFIHVCGEVVSVETFSDE